MSKRSTGRAVPPPKRRPPPTIAELEDKLRRRKLNGRIRLVSLLWTFGIGLVFLFGSYAILESALWINRAEIKEYPIVAIVAVVVRVVLAIVTISAVGLQGVRTYRKQIQWENEYDEDE